MVESLGTNNTILCMCQVATSGLKTIGALGEKTHRAAGMVAAGVNTAVESTALRVSNTGTWIASWAHDRRSNVEPWLGLRMFGNGNDS